MKKFDKGLHKVHFCENLKSCPLFLKRKFLSLPYSHIVKTGPALSKSSILGNPNGLNEPDNGPAQKHFVNNFENRLVASEEEIFKVFLNDCYGKNSWN